MFRAVTSFRSNYPFLNPILPLPFVFTRLFSNQQSFAKETIIPGTKKLKPRTPGTRHARIADRSHLHPGRPIFHLTTPLKKSGGRNNNGRITVRGRGGGAKRRYRLVDFRRDFYDAVAKVVRLEYDPNRSAHLALLRYPDDSLHYILSPENLNVGDKIDVVPGNAMPLSKIPVGELVHNVELRPFGGGQLARAAGCFLRLLEKGCGPKGAYAAVEMKSKEKRLLRMNCLATIGRLGNVNHNRIVLGKAGRSRWLGRRPKVRGVAMNRCDHPHGGGRGKCKGKNPVSKWNVPAKGYRTRKKKHRTNQFRLSRRPMNKRRYKKKSEGASWNKIERSVVNKQNNNKDKK